MMIRGVEQCLPCWTLIYTKFNVISKFNYEKWLKSRGRCFEPYSSQKSFLFSITNFIG